MYTVFSSTTAQGYIKDRHPGRQAEKQLCVWLERQAHAGSMAVGQAGTQKVRKAMVGSRQMDRQTDR